MTTGPSAWLLAAAAGRLRPRHHDWADAMLAEASLCTTRADRFRWAWGCWLASLRTTTGPAEILSLASLPAGLALMTAYEWSADESAATLIVLALIALILGALRPRQALFSGAAIGLVVTCVAAFEALSGIHPAYETRVQTLAGSLHWLILLPPALTAAALGGWISRTLRPGRPTPR